MHSTATYDNFTRLTLKVATSSLPHNSAETKKLSNGFDLGEMQGCVTLNTFSKSPEPGLPLLLVEASRISLNMGLFF